MESNNNDYVLVLEDRTEVKNEQEVERFSVVSVIEVAVTQACLISSTQYGQTLNYIAQSQDGHNCSFLAL